MKFLIFAMILSVSSVAVSKPKKVSASRIPASQTSLVVNCESPGNLAGGGRVVVNGTLTLSDLPDGSKQAAGDLRFQFTRNGKTEDFTKPFIGKYDDLTSIGSRRTLFGGVMNNDEAASLLIVYDDPSLSNTEYREQFHPLSCR